MVISRYTLDLLLAQARIYSAMIIFEADLGTCLLKAMIQERLYDRPST